MLQKRSIVQCVAIAGLALAMSGGAHAGGFYAPYVSGKAIGTALAGASARSDDPSFFFYNPATITGLGEAALSVEGRVFVPTVRINVTSATEPFLPGGVLNGANITAAGSSGSMADTTLAPGFAAAIPLRDDLWLGFGFSGHFATDIDTAPGWAGRFHLTKTKLIGSNFTGALAWELNDMVSIAAGVQVQYFDADMRKSEAIPVGPLGSPPFVEAPGFLKGTDWGFGAVLGLTVRPTPDTTIGIGYRSRITHTIEGTAGIVGNPASFDGATFDVKLPDIVSVGIDHRVHDALRLFGEAQWVGWSRFDGFNIAFASGRPNELRPQSWDDTWMVALGAGYMVTPDTEVTVGVQFDTAVTKGGNTLSPDGDRIMIGVGLDKQLANGGSLSVHYAHVFYDDAAINVTGPTSGTLVGTFESSLDIIGVSLKLPLGGVFGGGNS